MSLALRRAWEIIPGLLSWLTLVGLLIGAFLAPNVIAIIILIYAIYWLIRILIMTGYLAAGFWRYRQEIRTNWLKRLQADYPQSWEELYHLAIIATYKEDISILRHTLEAIRQSDYPASKLIVMVAFEARDKANAAKYAKLLTHEFEPRFFKFLTTIHPDGISGEVRGKGPNITWAARRAKEWVDERQLNYHKIITTTLDADNRVDKQYFANLSWAYLNDPDPYHKSFQPLPMFFNNIWQVPLPVKITALGSSFWQMIQAMRPYYARNFSAHAQSFAALVATDFWSTQTIVEDGHQYWRSFFTFNGNHHIVPIFVPVYMDAVQGQSLSDTFKQQYLQRRRWFWGVSDVPFVFGGAFRNGTIPFFYKWLQFARLVESHWSLATQSFVLLIGWLPVLLNVQFQNSVLGYNFPIIYRIFLFAAWIGMIASMAVASAIVPPKPGRRSGYILTLLKEWILAPLMLPISGIFFSAIPALDSQTRLMLSKPFTVFNVTKKVAIPSGVVRVGS